ncbi:hypothetical protein GRI58_08730 [Porphyrobacter algicida]|uniref:Lipoprotein n=1 Tax=Qipengyuania algicida TaxID=1836209 RepID=A0A845AK30_9SPHN|nr:hypothetical protein [Qipengyuania algicida]MXP28906.1 hypothetical protein [Qipengyuania algicida]
MKRLALFAPLILAGCSSQPAPTQTPSATPTVAAPRTLVAADYDHSALGAKIDLGIAPDEELPIKDAQGKQIATLLASVACPQDSTQCVPKDMPKGTVYTYLLTITPTPPSLGSPEPIAPLETGAASTTPRAENPPVLFRLTRAATGFNGAVGYSHSQALDALGSEDAITVNYDTDEIIWRVTDGSGWEAGMPITFWWQSTVPPTGTAKAYHLEIGGHSAVVDAPFPPPQAASGTKKDAAKKQ